MGGSKSQAFGSLFETVFMKACQSLSDIAVTRIPDGCRQFRTSIVRVPSPWDWVITHKGQTALLDTKTVQGDSFPISAVTRHQIEELSNHGHRGAISGYIVWLRKQGEVIFLPSDVLMHAVIKNQRGSFSKSHESAILLGSLTVCVEFDIRKIFTKEKLSEIPKDLPKTRMLRAGSA